MRHRSRLINIGLILNGIFYVVIALLVNSVSNTLNLSPRVSWSLLVLVAIAGIVVGVWIYRLQNQPSLTMKRRERERMLAKARIWIDIHLKKHLGDATLIPPFISVQQDYPVSSREEGLLELLPPTHPLLRTWSTGVYDNDVGELLLLGAPGSGKTTLLLDLAQFLLERASLNHDFPIPVVFDLTSWSNKRQPIADWLVEELDTTYRVKPEIGQPWVYNEMILPLLDGLDKVASDYRASCVDAINTYHSLQGPTVVCCGSTEYERLSHDHPLYLGKTIVIRSFTLGQIDDYLKRLGTRVGDLHTTQLRIAVQNDSRLRELVSTPLVLSLLAQLVRTSGKRPLTSLPEDAWRREVFDTYVERMFEEVAGEKVFYTSQQGRWWLSWLAKHMLRYGQTGFYIERLQPDWLPSDKSRQVYRSITSLILVELFCVATGFLVGSIPGVYFGFLIGLLIGLLNILLNIVLRSLWPWLRYLLKSLCFGLFSGFNFASLTMFFIGIYSGQNLGLTNGAIFGVIVGVFGLFVDRLAGEPDMKVEPAETVVRSWPRVGIIVFVFLSLGLVSGVIFAQFISASDSRTNQIVLGLVVGLVLGLFFGLISGWEYREIEETEEKKRITPNQGIRNLARNGARNGLIVGLLSGPLIGLFLGTIAAFLLREKPQALFGLTLHSDVAGVPVWLEVGLLLGLYYTLSCGLFTGVVAALFNGWNAWIKHFVLRFLLWLGGYIPWKYAHFLNYASQRKLLFKAGGRYEFVHDLLMGYIASSDQDALPVSSSAPFSGQNSSIGLHSTSRASILKNILVLILIIGCIGLSVGAFQELKQGIDTVLLTPTTTFNCNPSAYVTPTTSGAQITSPSGRPIDSIAAVIVSHIRTASTIDSNNCPSKLTNVFRVKQIVYVAFDLQLQGKTGYMEAKWYFNMILANTGTAVVDSLQDVNGSFGLPYPAQGRGITELYWCNKSDCSDARLAGFVGFTITS